MDLPCSSIIDGLSKCLFLLFSSIYFLSFLNLLKSFITQQQCNFFHAVINMETLQRRSPLMKHSASFNFLKMHNDFCFSFFFNSPKFFLPRKICHCIHFATNGRNEENKSNSCPKRGNVKNSREIMIPLGLVLRSSFNCILMLKTSFACY